jgi:hypothetical protein
MDRQLVATLLTQMSKVIDRHSRRFVVSKTAFMNVQELLHTLSTILHVSTVRVPAISAKLVENTVIIVEHQLQLLQVRTPEYNLAQFKNSRTIRFASL